MTTKGTIKKVWNVTTSVIVVVVVLLALFLMGSRIMGFRIFTVISPSMEPEFGVGDLIYVKEVDPTTIKVGDPITFIVNEDLLVGTHRVIEIDAEKKHFYTKGDANDTPDAAPVHFNNLIGKPVFSIPLLGYVSNWIQNPPGMYIAIALGFLLVVVVFLPDFVKKKPEEAAVQSEELAQEQAELEQMRAELAAAKAELEAMQAAKGESTPSE